VLTPGFTGALPGRDALAEDLQRQLGQSRGYEDSLSLVRRWSGDQRFRAGVHVLRHLSSPEAVGWFLSDAADLAVAALLPEVEAEFARRHGGFGGPRLAVLALGKLGSRQMSFRSDLDLITVYDVPPGLAQSDGPKPLTPGDYHTRLTQRLIAAITAPTAEGPLFEVDMRLRPSGNAGPLAVSLDGFVSYHADRAWTWEHLALTRARVVAGPPDLARRLDQAVRAVLTRRRDPDTLLRDVAAMRARIDREFGTTRLWEVKYVRGGTIDAEFIAQTLMLRHGHDHPGVLATDSLTALARLAGAGLLDPETAADLIGALRLWFAVQGFLRLAAGTGFAGEDAPPGLKAGLMTAVLGEEAAGFDFPGFERHLRSVAAVVHGHFTALIEDPARRVEETA
jgi:glutamate-ammonia-ligase adenylyltransferase